MADEIEECERQLEEAREQIRAQKKMIEDLQAENEELREQLRVLKRKRPQLSPESLMDSFRVALSKMEEGLAAKGKGRVNYALKTFDTDLKTALTLDDEGNVNFMLPKAEDIIPSENLSTIRFRIASVPAPEVPPPSTGQIPNLYGKSKDAAVAAIEAAEFVVGDVEERASTLAPGTVIEQDPEPYAIAELGMTVDLVVSRARETQVPEVIGLELDAAVEVLESARLSVGQVTEEVSDSPPGTVIGQGIPGGTTVALNTAVDLIVAKAATTEVPDLIGAPLDRAREMLKKARLRAGPISREASEKPEGTVIRQQPQAGSEVAVNARVRLVVARPRQATVPHVLGMDLERALEAIEEAGLETDEVVHEPSDERPGTVIAVEPEGGTEVEPGSEVTVIVSKSQRVIVPDLTGLTQEEAERVARHHDLKVGRIIRRRSRESEGTIIGQKPEGGTEVRAGTSIRLTLPIG
jgi:beta-lactam-binding protein with PASTA domain